jgi:hypothetical protein
LLRRRRTPHPQPIDAIRCRRRGFRARLAPWLAFLSASCGGPSKQPPALEGAAAAATPAPAAIDPAGFRTAIDLYANRVHAALHRDGRLVVDAGGLDFLKYVDGGWKTSWLLGGKDEGHPAALVAGLSAVVFLPVDEIADATLSITMRALAPRWRGRASATTWRSRRRCCARATTVCG